MSGHTPTPWEIIRDSSIIFGKNDPERYKGRRVAVAQCGDELVAMGGLKVGGERDANAEFIVLAVNHHDELVAALKGVLVAANGIAGSEAELAAVAVLAKIEKGGRS